MTRDVPSPIDLRLMRDAVEWVSTERPGAAQRKLAGFSCQVRHGQWFHD